MRSGSRCATLLAAAGRWSEEGGRAITFASDAHTTNALANNLYEAMAMTEHFSFRQGRQPEDFWTR
jgi:histidinol-phosphatase (PHP family)